LNAQNLATDLTRSNIIVLPIDVNSFLQIPEIIDNKVIDWNHVVNVHSTIHNQTHGTPDDADDSNDDENDCDFVDYFQDDPNPVIHTTD